MEKVDSLIDTLAEHIEKLILSNTEYCNNEIAEKTKALAELISARAGMIDTQIKREIAKSPFSGI